jgi:hypothetical protein
MLTRILSFHQVMPEFLDFVSVFGIQDSFRSLRFSAFKQQSSWTKTIPAIAVQGLERSRLRYQICYNLRALVGRAESLDVQGTTMWPQQAAFHHQFDLETGNALWITVKGNLDIKTRLAGLDLDFSTFTECFKSSLKVHLVHLRWATEGWTRYLQWLEEKIDQEVSFHARCRRSRTQIFRRFG